MAADRAFLTALWAIVDGADTVLRATASGPLRLLDERNEKQALLDPLYVYAVRQREQSRAAGEPYTFDEYVQIRELADLHARHPWWEAPLDAATRNPVRRGVNVVVFATQRVTRGWSDDATWSLDMTLTRVLADQLDHLANTSHGYPGTDEYPTFAKWQEDLRANAAALRAYGQSGMPDDEDAIRGAQEALRWVAEFLPHLWD